MSGPYFGPISNNDLQLGQTYVVDTTINIPGDEGGGTAEFTITLGSGARLFSSADAASINEAVTEAMANALASYDWATLSLGDGYTFASAAVTLVSENDDVIYTAT